ncbi:MAG: hypothetical protein JXQ83_11635, partial [Candidatus Glassbacteria bacterium]|nr:hypothetical protein [Candidatus Glassbacteria bacterium]
ESLLSGDLSCRSSLSGYRSLSGLVQLAVPDDPDEISRQRDWEKVASGLSRTKSRRGRKFSFGLGLAAAAVLAVFFLHPFGAAVNNRIVVESIDCTYDSFLLLNPSSEDGHTIIWINDQSSTNR